MTPTPDPLPEHGFAENRPMGPRTGKGHALAFRLRKTGDEVDWDAWVRSIEDEAVALAQPAPALDVAGEALHALLAPDLEIQARIEGVEAFVMYAVPGFAPGDAAYLMRAAERYSAIVRGDPA